VILVGQYSSPFVRRVGVSLRVLGFEYQHDTRPVFRDFDSVRQTNPVGRIPSLVLDDGEVLIDSAAILDWLDEAVGPARALLPRAGPDRRRALRAIAFATGAIRTSGRRSAPSTPRLSCGGQARRRVSLRTAVFCRSVFPIWRRLACSGRCRSWLHWIGVGEKDFPIKPLIIVRRDERLRHL
jgi:glutathione S-transferase